MTVPREIELEHRQVTIDAQAHLALLRRIEAEAAITIESDRLNGAAPDLHEHWNLRFAREQQAKLLPIMQTLCIPETHREPAPKRTATVIPFAPIGESP